MVAQALHLRSEVDGKLYMDCACCNGKPGFRELHTAAPLGPGSSTTEGTGTSVAALQRSIFQVKLGAMHPILRIGREINAEHPLPQEISHGLESGHVQQGDRDKLMDARTAAHLDEPPTRTERVKYIRQVVDVPETGCSLF